MCSCRMNSERREQCYVLFNAVILVLALYVNLAVDVHCSSVEIQLKCSANLDERMNERTIWLCVNSEKFKLKRLLLSNLVAV